jgi:hypothetical protein
MAYAVTTEKKILGANYGLSFIVPAVNTRFTSNLFDKSAEAAGVSDLYFSPIVLGWEMGNATYILNYGFYAPSGDFDPSKALNPGLGFWEHQIQGGMTYSFDEKKLWNGSFLTTWEINMSKTGLDITPGPMFTAEYSLGRRFFKYAGTQASPAVFITSSPSTPAAVSICWSPAISTAPSPSARSSSSSIPFGISASTSATSSSSVRCPGPQARCSS